MTTQTSCIVNSREIPQNFKLPGGMYKKHALLILKGSADFGHLWCLCLKQLALAETEVYIFLDGMPNPAPTYNVQPNDLGKREKR